MKQFQLDKSKGRNKRDVCPRCHGRTFCRYVDSNGVHLHVAVGECVRTMGCQYRYTPKEFFLNLLKTNLDLFNMFVKKYRVPQVK